MKFTRDYLAAELARSLRATHPEMAEDLISAILNRLAPDPAKVLLADGTEARVGARVQVISGELGGSAFFINSLFQPHGQASRGTLNVGPFQIDSRYAAPDPSSEISLHHYAYGSGNAVACEKCGGIGRLDSVSFDLSARHEKCIPCYGSGSGR